MGCAMIQPEDNRTLPLPLPEVTEKRGRGRPRKEGALSNAQRQAAYRVRHKASGNPVTVTKKIPAAADGYDELVLENERLRERLAEVGRELREAREALGRPVGHRWSYRHITAVAEAQIRRYLERARVQPNSMTAAQCRDWAFGAYLAWYGVTNGWIHDGDSERLRALTEDGIWSNENSEA
jgi:hypothetical protein